MVDWNISSILIFYIVLAALIFIFRKKIIIEKVLGFLPVIMFKTKKGISFIDKLSKIKRFWKVWGLIGIGAGYLAMAAVVILLIFSLWKLISVPTAQAGVVPVLPGMNIPGYGVLNFWYWIIGLLVVILVHEGAHGVVARAYNLKLKSVGAGLLAVLPFAFVEPDEKQLAKRPLKEQLSVFAAGSWSNFCTAGIILLLSLFLLAPAMSAALEPAGIQLMDVTKDTPADKTGLEINDIITGLNGKPILSNEDFHNGMLPVAPGEAINLRVNGEQMSLTTINNPQNASRAYIGISFKTVLAPKEQVAEKYGRFLPSLLPGIYSLFNWLFAFNLGIGIFNMLPLGPIDGGKMAGLLFAKAKNQKLAKRVFQILATLSLVLLLLNLIGPIFR